MSTGILTILGYKLMVDITCRVDRCNDPPTPHISLHSPPKSHHRHCIAVTPPFSLPDLSDGETRALRIAINTESETVQAELIIPGEMEEVLPLWEAKLPGSGKMAGSSKRLLGLTASTGGIAQAVS